MTIPSNAHSAPEASKRSSHPRRSPAWFLLLASVSIVAMLLAACSSTTSTPNSASSGSTPIHPSSPQPATDVSLTIQTGKMDGKPNWPRFVPANFSVANGTKVVLTITSYDDGPSPLPAGMTTYDSVQGGTETVDGRSVTSVPNSNLSHTFTVPQLGLNVAIPAVTSGEKSVTVVFTFTATKSGSFIWKCMAPCGSGSDGMGGAMAAAGWMRGTITVA